MEKYLGDPIIRKFHEISNPRTVSLLNLKLFSWANIKNFFRHESQDKHWEWALTGQRITGQSPEI